MRSSFLYFKGAHDALQKLLLLSAGDYNQESYHDIRIYIKKMVAVVEMIKYFDSDIDKKDYCGLLKIFRHAGTVRTLYIDREITKKYSKCKVSTCKNIFDLRIEVETIKNGI